LNFEVATMIPMLTAALIALAAFAGLQWLAGRLLEDVT
jgi:hypothetical protein